MTGFSEMTLNDFDGGSGDPVDQHVKRLKAALYNRIQPRRSVYLDTKFWVNLRKFVLGDVAFNNYGPLLNLLRKRAADGSLFCPVSESTIAELCKQTDPNTRAATATLIDELSLGVSLEVLHERMRIEIACLPGVRRSENAVLASHKMVWTKVAYAFGPLYPSKIASGTHTKLESIIDAQWDATLVDVLSVLDFSQRPADSFDRLATFVNGDNALRVNEIKNFKQIFEISMSEVAEFASPFLANILVHKFEEQYVRPTTDAEQRRMSEVAQSTLTNLLVTSQSHTLLPTLHIYAALHAFVRSVKTHKLKANDFPDFHHACAALGYCDVFLTDGPLKSYVTHKLSRLDSAYQCVVVDSVGDALSVIEAI